jgi:putative phosphoesterase
VLFIVFGGDYTMKLGIIADTHDNLGAIKRAVAYFNQAEVKQVVHAGDFVAPFALSAFRELKADFMGVWGNNDGERLLLMQKARESGFELNNPPHHFRWGDKRILLMHEPYELDALIKSRSYDLIVYGHLHKAEVRLVDSCLVINPGECGGWLTRRCTVAVVDKATWSGQVVEI